MSDLHSCTADTTISSQTINEKYSGKIIYQPFKIYIITPKNEYASTV